MRTLANRMLPSQHHVQQHTQRINVCRCRNGSARNLFRRRKLRSQRPGTFCGKQRRRKGGRVIRKQLCNPKIQQLYLAIISDEHDGRLDITMDDQIGMCLCYCTEHIEEKPDSCVHIEPVAVAVFVDLLSFYMFENEIWFTIRSHARIDQFCDVGIGKTAENLSFALESLSSALCNHSEIQKLHRYSSLEAPIATLC